MNFQSTETLLGRDGKKITDRKIRTNPQRDCLIVSLQLTNRKQRNSKKIWKQVGRTSSKHIGH